MKGQNIIIKKKKKSAHQGGHGGQWKVAYADFVTAMMAFFLLMWLITMTSPKKKLSLKNYFQNVTVFEQMGLSFMDFGSAPFDYTVTDTEDVVDIPRGGDMFAIAKDMVMQKFMSEIGEKLADVKDQVLIDIFEGGVKIQIVDKEGRPMFPVGSNFLTDEGQKILKVIAGVLNEIEEIKIAIEGHTDALKYSGTDFTNWELSTSRASAARLQLEKFGVKNSSLKKVTGFADTQPLVVKNPLDPRNRRISILVYTTAESVKNMNPKNVDKGNIDKLKSLDSIEGLKLERNEPKITPTTTPTRQRGDPLPSENKAHTIKKQFFLK